MKYKKYLNEAAKHPSQDSAEIIAKLKDMFSSLSYGGVDSDIRKKIEQMDKIRLSMWDSAFGDKSPWSIKLRKGRSDVYWDDNKAEKLGL